jgi:hypothetical protein
MASHKHRRVKSKPARKRTDWSKVPAPKRGTKARKAYEQSAVYKKRRQAAFKAAESRRAAYRPKVAGKRKTAERAARMRAMRKALEPKLKKLIDRYEMGGTFWDNSRELHGNWYAEKLDWEDMLPENEYLAVLEAMSDDNELDEIGWDIIY